MSTSVCVAIRIGLSGSLRSGRGREQPGEGESAGNAGGHPEEEGERARVVAPRGPRNPAGKPAGPVRAQETRSPCAQGRLVRTRGFHPEPALPSTGNEGRAAPPAAPILSEYK